VAAVATTAAALVLLLPVFYSYGWDLSNQIGRLRGRPPAIFPQTHRRAAVVEMANWLRTNTPAPSNWMNPLEKPAYGILAPWTIGHILEYEARRPTVTDNFGDDIGRENFLLARRYYQSDEPAAAELLERLSVRYVIAQRAPNFLGEDPVPGSVFFSLFRSDGSAAERQSEGGAAPALTRHRLIFEARPLPGAEPAGEASFKVFEFVSGATVAGRASPGAQIRVTLPVRTNRGRKFVYTAEIAATTHGEYSVRVPYANTEGLRSVRVAPTYTFECRGERRAVRVDERAVAQGDRIEGPALCPSD
jgi:dolichyl-diphosphooligosaccharide--protein glycosyltransferase